MKPLIAKNSNHTLKMQVLMYYALAHTYAYAYCVFITNFKIGILSQKWMVQKHILNILSFGYYLEEIQYCNVFA